MLLFVSLRSPSSMLNLCHAKLPKVVSDLFTTLNCGKGGDEICFVNAQYNFAVLPGCNSLKGYAQDCSN